MTRNVLQNSYILNFVGNFCEQEIINIYFRIVGTLEKYDSKTKKWKTISAISNPEFIW